MLKLCSDIKSMCVCFNFGLVVLREGTWAGLNRNPILFFATDFALLAFTRCTNYVTTFVRPYFLPSYFFIADSTTKIILYFFNN